MATRMTAKKLPFELVDSILRVNYAGELGADRIYAGQMAVLGKSTVGPTIQHMWDQEKHHLRTFQNLITKYRARPTIMMPIWNIAGFVLGAGSALFGSKAAMSCTVAVEDVISKHYDKQIRQLTSIIAEDKKELLETLKQFRDDEMEHHDIALDNIADQTLSYSLFTNAIKAGCHIVIEITKQV